MTEKPSIDLSRIKDLTVNAGQEIKILLPLKGWPIPNAVWEINGKEITPGGRVKIEVTYIFLYALYFSECIV